MYQRRDVRKAGKVFAVAIMVLSAVGAIFSLGLILLLNPAGYLGGNGWNPYIGYQAPLAFLVLCVLLAIGAAIVWFCADLAESMLKLTAGDGSKSS
jgi:ABC-type transport system involved in multi-copper enzyme maturation permease subunit